MDEYHFFADVLSKYSQFTPWVQVALAAMAFGSMLGLAYFLKEIILALTAPWAHRKHPTADTPKKEWRDKYYRGEER